MSNESNQAILKEYEARFKAVSEGSLGPKALEVWKQVKTAPTPQESRKLAEEFFAFISKE